MPYISNIETNAGVLVFILMMVFAASVTNMVYIGLTPPRKECPWWKMVVAAIIGVSWAYLWVWVFMGDPVWWSKPIGVWLKS